MKGGCGNARAQSTPAETGKANFHEVDEFEFEASMGRSKGASFAGGVVLVQCGPRGRLIGESQHQSACSSSSRGRGAH